MYEITLRCWGIIIGFKEVMFALFVWYIAILWSYRTFFSSLLFILNLRKPIEFPYVLKFLCSIDFANLFINISFLR